MIGAPVIQANYEQLAKVSKEFLQHSEHIARMNTRLNRQFDVLQNGAWVGGNADKFFGAMTDEVFPAVGDLKTVLHEASSVVLQIIRIFQDAEQEAGNAFPNDGSIFSGNTSGGVVTGGSGSPSTTSAPKPTLMRPTYQAGNIPLYVTQLSDPNFNPQAFVNSLDPGDRPVIFVVHGFNDNAEGYPAFTDFVNQQYGGMNPPPIVVGVEWDSSTLTGGMAERAAIGGIFGGVGGAVFGAGSQGIENYQQGEANARQYGPRMGELLEAYNYAHPNSSVNVIAHSLGNGLTMEGIASNDVKINSYIAVQAAVDQAEVAPGMRYEDVLDVNEVNRLGVTYTDDDNAVGGARRVAGFGPGLGSYGADESLQRPNGTTTYYDMEDYGQWLTGMNHYSYNDQPVQQDVIPNIWGADGSGLVGGRDPRFN